MKRSEHSAAFTVVRDLVLDELEECDRRALARLFGAMHEPQPDPTPTLAKALRAIARLDDDEIVRLARWFRSWVNKWGQVPIASSRRVDPKANRKTTDS